MIRPHDELRQQLAGTMRGPYRIKGVRALQELAAHTYALARLDQTREGDRWVSSIEFVAQAVERDVATTQDMTRLYNTLLAEGGPHVYGGPRG